MKQNYNILCINRHGPPIHPVVKWVPGINLFRQRWFHGCLPT